MVCKGVRSVEVCRGYRCRRHVVSAEGHVEDAVVCLEHVEGAVACRECQRDARRKCKHVEGAMACLECRWGARRKCILKRELAIGQGNESVADHCCNGK